MYVNFAACQRSDDLLYEEIPKGPLRHGAALVLALLLCTTAALAAEPVQRSLIPVGHTVGVKLFARGVVVVKLPENRRRDSGVRRRGRDLHGAVPIPAAKKRNGLHGAGDQTAGQPADPLCGAGTE